MEAVDYKQIQKKFEKLSPYFDERGRRLWAATEAISVGYGGVSAVSRATDLSRNTIISAWPKSVVFEKRLKYVSPFPSIVL